MTIGNFLTEISGDASKKHYTARSPIFSLENTSNLSIEKVPEIDWYWSFNQSVDYTAKQSHLDPDINIFIQSDLKWDTKIEYATSKANIVLRCIRKSFKYPQSELIKLLYTSLVRPHLEYAISSCCPFLEKDIKELEKVKRRATKLESELRNLEYYDRLSKMNLTDLKTRGLRGDLIQMYKIINGLECINLKKGIQVGHIENIILEDIDQI
ncbi:unnamed protein product [Brachionus calyciflorus]|uniref:Uncharacterized protein n=1 Tax=Brachionus calyciflorus TaxID=104777 RepID=A0A814FQJ1_9BILA|nr:unnamed protein product [Brachionus calyciflorus]